MFDINEIIHCESYYDLCDYHYKGQDDLPSGVVHVDIQALQEFIEKISGNNNRYVVICSRSDFGLCIQAEHPPWQDLEKWCGMSVSKKIGYDDIIIHARVDRNKCNENDKYAIKCWSFTSHTFNEIPQNIIHLFVTNNFVKDDRITSIPFGVNGTDGGRDAVNKISTLQIDEEKRDKLLYVNFQFYTVDRARLWMYYQNVDWATIYQSNRNTEEFYNDLATHKYILCPEGNGPDCYRMLEAIYCGAVPIMPMNDALYFYFENKVKASFSRNLFNLNHETLSSAYEQIKQLEWNMEFVKLSYWKRLIDAKRSLI